MYYLIIAMLLGLACPSQKNTKHQQGTITVADDTGGDGGHIPPTPPKP